MKTKKELANLQISSNYLGLPINKIVNYPKVSNEKSVNVGDKVIITFLISLLYMVSALEEADWSIYSRKLNSKEDENDLSNWSIYRLLPFLNSH